MKSNQKQSYCKKIDRLLDKHVALLLILLIALLLRIPSFFEPVWYLDESIYLTIGSALSDGQVLYRDIVDHKTPVIYFLAMVGGQPQFRALLTIWMLANTAALYFVLRRSGIGPRNGLLATLFFAIITTLPKFEGLLPNAELFILGFLVWALLLLSKSNIWQTALQSIHKNGLASLVEKTPSSYKTQPTQSQTRFKLLLSGGLLGLAVLTKVPAIFDVVAVGSLLYVAYWRQRDKRSSNSLLAFLKSTAPEWSLIILGFLIPILLSILYFALRGAAAEYLQYGLLYNFRYAAAWSPSENPLITTLLSLPAKLAILTVLTILLTRFRSHLHPVMFWSGIWLGLALIAATLSNRPYPHYAIQVLLPLTFVLAAAIQVTALWWTRQRSLTGSHLGLISNWLVALILLGLSLSLWQVLDFWKYPTLTYYQSFIKLATRKQTLTEYQTSFSHLVANNYSLTADFQSAKLKSLYIWGTNPSLYVLTKTYPADQFTVLFHIQDLQHEFETTSTIMNARPDVIVLMKDATEPPPAFNSFMHNNYAPWRVLDHMTVWRLRSVQ